MFLLDNKIFRKFISFPKIYNKISEAHPFYRLLLSSVKQAPKLQSSVVYCVLTYFIKILSVAYSRERSVNQSLIFVSELTCMINMRSQ